MTASTSDSLAILGRRRANPLEFVAAFVLAFGGLVFLAIAAAAYALQFVHTLNPRQAADAAQLLGAAPVVVALAAAHILAAVLTLSDRRARLVAALLDTLATALAVTGFVLVAVGADPLSGWRSGSAAATSDGLGIMAVLALVYAAAAIVTVRSVANDRPGVGR